MSYQSEHASWYTYFRIQRVSCVLRNFSPLNPNYNCPRVAQLDSICLWSSAQARTKAGDLVAVLGTFPHPHGTISPCLIHMTEWKLSTTTRLRPGTCRGYFGSRELHINPCDGREQNNTSVKERISWDVFRSTRDLFTDEAYSPVTNIPSLTDILGSRYYLSNPLGRLAGLGLKCHMTYQRYDLSENRALAIKQSEAGSS